MSQAEKTAGKKVLITGATAGIGLAAARKIAAYAEHIILTGRSAERAQPALEELRALGVKADFLSGDSADEVRVPQMVSEAAAIMGGVDTVVSSGAESRSGLLPFESMTVADIRKNIDRLFFARVLPVHAAIPYLKENGGSIVMITSDAGRHVTPGESMVGANAAMIILMTKSLARELARYRIRVNSVGLTLTSQTPGWDAAFASELGRKVFSKAVDRFPFGRAPEADEVGSAIAFLSSDAAAQVSGQTLSVNGALSFGGW